MEGGGHKVISQHVRSGQYLTCTFRANCCSARLSRAQVPAFAGSSVRDRKRKEVREYWRVQGSTSSPTGIGSRRRLTQHVLTKTYLKYFFENIGGGGGGTGPYYAYIKYKKTIANVISILQPEIDGCRGSLGIV